MSRKLIEIHSESPVRLSCDLCDGPSSFVTKWYKIPGEDLFGERIVLDCCKHKGVVVDWENCE